eukprot:m.18786 g.18786  ORF g.18786 m.18786 type:complete len:370 (+) comp12213_c0_seq1:376-1485(+)
MAERPPPVPTEASTAAWAKRIQSQASSQDAERVRRLATQQTRARGNYEALNSLQFSNAASSMAFRNGLEQCVESDKAPIESRSALYEEATIYSTVQSQRAQTLHTYENLNGGRHTHEQQEAMTQLAGEMGMGNVSRFAREDDKGPNPIYETLVSARANPLMSAAASSPVVQLANNAKLAGKRDMQELLQHLRAEPNSDEERAAKFSIYEMAASTLEKARDALFKIWQDCAIDFEHKHENVKVQIEEKLQGIDHADNMGIADSDRVWFVFGMANKVLENADKIDKVMRMIITKLELLGNQTECPVCLENFQQNTQVATLVCAHMVCSACWTHWEDVQRALHQPVFCPMCRQDDFGVAINVFASTKEEVPD